MNTIQKENLSIARKILLIFIAVLLVQIFLFAISLSLATASLVEDVTHLRIEDYLRNAELLDNGVGDNEFLKETSGQYLECVIISLSEDGENEFTYSEGLGKLVSATQLQTIIDEAYEHADEDRHYGYMKTSFNYIYYGSSLTNNDTLVIGFSSDTYLNNSIFNLILVVVGVYTIIYFTGAAIILFWARNVVKRLNNLCDFVDEMPSNEYKKAYNDDGDDEIYTLSIKIDEMRRTILNDEAAKNAMLQNVSHDLKTPVAVIKSYSEAIEDGIEDISATKIIIAQCDKLEKKIKRFIEYNKLEQLSSENMKHKVEMKPIILELVNNLKYLTDKTIETDLDNTCFYGRTDNYYIVCENIVENAIRYAKKAIKITLKDGVLTIFNDGKPIDDQFINQGFKPYEKGSEGKFGLGMSIVSRTLDIFEMRLIVENINDGVLFTIKKK